MSYFINIFKQIYYDFKKYKAFILVYFIFSVFSLLIFGSICPVAISVGFPCPGCGVTRAFLCVITLRFRAAFQMNPSVYLWLTLGIYIFIYRYIKKKPAQHLNRLFIITGCLTILIYIFRMILMYPDTEPMTFHTPNLLKALRTFFC